MSQSEELSAEGWPPDQDGRDFHGESRKNDTHASKTDPDTKLYRRSHHGDVRLAYLGHLIIENRHGLIVDAMATTVPALAQGPTRSVLSEPVR